MDDQFSLTSYTNSMSTNISVETESVVTDPLDDTYNAQDVETLATNEVLQMYDQNYYLTAIGGMIIAIVSIVVIIIGLIVCCIRHRKEKEAPTVNQSLKYGDEITSSKFKWETLLSGSMAEKSRTKIEFQKVKTTNMDSKLATAMDGTVEASMLASINVPLNPEEQFTKVTSEVAEKSKRSVPKATTTKNNGSELQKSKPVATATITKTNADDKSTEKRSVYIKIKRKSVATIKGTTQSGTASTTS